MLLLVVSLVLLGWLVWGMVVDLRSKPVEYKVQSIAPANSFLCPGDQLRYPVVLEVRDVPTVLTIVESWCRAGTDGVCSQATTVQYQVPVLRPRTIDTMAVRTLPKSPFFRPGDKIEFQHATTDGKVVTGYVVEPIVIRDNCDAAEVGQ
jgi:hypothetical protein